MARHTASLRAACAGLLLATMLTVAAEPSVDALTVAAPAKIDLDAFDASRQYAQLPNGVRMAYWDVGPRSPVRPRVRARERGADGTPPVLRRLLGPATVAPRHTQSHAGVGQYRAVKVHQDRLEF